MSDASAAIAVQGELDRIAKIRQAMQGVISGDNFWTRVDAAGDETYENCIKGIDMTALDAAIATAGVWSTAELRKWFTLHNQYFQAKLLLASPYLASYLATIGWRIPYEAGEAYHEALISRVAAQYVFPKGTRPADESDPATSGMHKFQTWVDSGGTEVKTAVDGVLENCYAVAVAISQTASPGGSGHTVTITLSDGTTKNVTFTPDATQYGHILIGSQAVGGAGAAAGQKVVPVAATAQFKAATYALLLKADLSVAELILIDSIVTNTSVTATANLINSFAENDLVIPLVSNCVWQAGTLSNDKTVDFYAWPDRIIAL